MQISKLTRRNFVALSAAAGAVAALPSSAFALNDAQAKALIDKTPEWQDVLGGKPKA